jgi:CheY-like chemotaxis protein
LADATQLRQVIMNLVINAGEALGEGTGYIHLATGTLRAKRAHLKQLHLSPELPEGEYVTLEVRDTGCGMTPEVLARIFDPFYTTKFTGRGLGLAAVLGIIRGHRGGIQVTSHPGRGSAFRVYLPTNASQPGAEHSSPRGMQKWRASGTVLLVDDEEVVRQVTNRILKSFGLSVIEAVDGREAVVLFERHAAQISCVLLDLTMPHLTGEQTFAALRVIRPEVPILLMSGYSEQEAVNRFPGKALSGFLQKPFASRALREQLERVLTPVRSATEGTLQTPAETCGT